MKGSHNMQGTSKQKPKKEVSLNILNPIGRVTVEPVKPALRLGDLNNKKICLFWNGKTRGDLALKRVKELLMERFAGLSFSQFMTKTYTETVHPDEIDAIVFTHLHWDHVQNMKKFKNARYIAPKAEIEMAYNPLPLYYRTYECGILDIEPAYAGCVFEAVADECEVLPGITMFHTPGHSVGHMGVTVATSAGDIVVAGDAIFVEAP